MKKHSKFSALILTALFCASSIIGCGSDSKSSLDSNKTTTNLEESSTEQVNLTFSIWDSNQKTAMENIAKAFTKENPNITVTVEVTPWDQYWTKLQASATGGTMPDVFWMHPEKIYDYVDGSMLMDMTDRIKSSELDLANYPEFINGDFNVNDKQYGIPKDYSTVGLWYNKDIFDAAGIAYPDDTWTWDTWMDTAAKLTNKDKGIYGMLAPCNGQNYYYNLIWQNGSDIISQDEKDSLYDDPKTIAAIQYATSFIEKGYSPTTSDFANTTADQYFESGKAAMITAGSWMTGEYLAVDGLNCDVAPMPKGTQRGSICGGMGYSIAANTKHPEESWKFMEFLAGEEANLIQSKSGAAISAYKGTQEPWVAGFSTIDAQVFVDASEYGYSSQYCSSRDDWSTVETDMMTQIFSGTLEVKDGCKQLADTIQQILDNE